MAGYGDPGFGGGQPGGWEALLGTLGLGSAAASPLDMPPGLATPMPDVRPPSPVEQLRNWWSAPGAAQPPGMIGPQQMYGPQVPGEGLPSLGESLSPGGGMIGPPEPQGPGLPNTGGTPSGGVSPQTAMARVAGQASGGTQNALASALRGITSPGRPDVVKPTTPHLVPPKAIQSGHLFQLLEQLGNYRQPLVPNRYQTLGQDLAGGR